MVRHFLVIIVAVASLAGCATGSQPRPIQQRISMPTTLPDKLTGQGLLVATIAANTVATTRIEQLAFSLADVQIDNTSYSNAIHNNYLVLPLQPGEYTLDSLHVFRNTTDRSKVRYPLNFRFRIVAGQATNLGVIVLVRNTKAQPSENRYWKIQVDNTEDMTSHLRKRYPKLAASLSPPAPVLASDVKYADANLMELMRRDIARDAWLWQEEPKLAQHVGGEVGTIAKLLRNTRGQVVAIDVLDSKTTAAMLSCSGHDQRFVCSSTEPALYAVKGSKLEKRGLPAPASHVWVHTFPPQGLVLVDQNMTVYTSRDDGASWKRHVWHPRKQPLGPLASIRFTNGRNGYYLYSVFSADPLAPEVLYSEYAQDGYRKVEIPKMKSWQRLVETSHGLIVGPQNSESDTETATLYFRPLAHTDWQARPLPGKRCFYLQRDAEGSDKLLIQCDSKYFSTTNSGTSWTETVSDSKQQAGSAP